MHTTEIIKPTAFLCFKSGCCCVVDVLKWGRMHHVCGECALVINSLISCPKTDPYPDPVKKPRNKSQTKEAMKRQIKMAEIKRDARNFQSYESKINTLSRKYK